MSAAGGSSNIGEWYYRFYIEHGVKINESVQNLCCKSDQSLIYVSKVTDLNPPCLGYMWVSQQGISPEINCVLFNSYTKKKEWHQAFLSAFAKSDHSRFSQLLNSGFKKFLFSVIFEYYLQFNLHTYLSAASSGNSSTPQSKFDWSCVCWVSVLRCVYREEPGW